MHVHPLYLDKDHLLFIYMKTKSKGIQNKCPLLDQKLYSLRITIYDGLFILNHICISIFKYSMFLFYNITLD